MLSWPSTTRMSFPISRLPGAPTRTTWVIRIFQAAFAAMMKGINRPTRRQLHRTVARVTRWSPPRRQLRKYLEHSAWKKRSPGCKRNDGPHLDGRRQDETQLKGDQMKKTIWPVCLAMALCSVAMAAGDATTGKASYDKACKSCHGA